MITKQILSNTLFGMVDILRDKVEDYKAYILFTYSSIVFPTITSGKMKTKEE